MGAVDVEDSTLHAINDLQHDSCDDLACGHRTGVSAPKDTE